MTRAIKGQGKTSFVKEFIQSNPLANSKAVNEAWTAAGMKGKISHTVVSEARKQLGLIGNQPGKTSTAAKAKSAIKISPGKTMFAKEFLNDHPQGNVDAVNQAWRAAGFAGTISPTLVNQLRAKLGLTGNLRGNTTKSRTSATGKKRGRPPKVNGAAVSMQPRGNTGGRMEVLNDMEADIDRLIFRAMAVGDLTEIEDTLRRARRLLYQTLTSG